MADFERLAEVMMQVLDSDIVLGPALSSAGIGGLDKRTYDLIRSEAVGLLGNRPYMVPTHPGHSVSNELALNAMTETISSTAAYLSHMKMGYLHVDEPMVMVASRLIQQQLKVSGYEDILSLMFMVNGYDDYQCLNHYGEVLESRFVSGELHRPWIHYTLREELEYLFDEGLVHRVGVNNSNIALTDAGRSLYQHRRSFLNQTGFLRRRAMLMRWTGFSELKEYDEMMERLNNVSEFRGKLVSESVIQPGMHVLELGCGTGELTFKADLYKRVGAKGSIIATDPSLGMLSRAKEKSRSYGAANVQFVQAAAEQLPFEDDSFDAIVGCLFLHFTDIPSALKEIHRVGKPGAVFTSIHALQFDQSEEFFLEWFAPVLGSGDQNQSRMLPERDTVPNAINAQDYADVQVDDLKVITRYQDPENVIKFVAQVANFFGDSISGLPWRAQQELFDKLITRGYQIREKYGAEKLVQLQPAQFVKARIVK